MAGIIFSEGSGVADSVYGKSQAPIRMFIEKKAEAFEAQSVLPLIFNMTTSQNWAEKFTSMTAMEGFMPVGENGAYPSDNTEEGYSKLLEHMTWKDEFSISQEMIEDAKLMDLKSKPQSFITGYHRTRELFGLSLLGGAMGQKTSVTFRGQKFDTTAADGKALFAKDHPSKVKGAAQSNCFSDAFSAKALAAVETEMQNFRGDNNEVLDVAPTTIIIPNIYDLKMDVFEAIGADKSTAEAGSNKSNFIYGRWNVIVSNLLNRFVTAGSKPWILMDKQYNDDYGSAMWLDRVQLNVRSVIADNDANVWKGRARFVAGFNDWRGFAVGGITGGTNLGTST